MRTPPDRPVDQQFNNADSYAMAFDAAWEKLNQQTAAEGLNREARLQQAIADLSDHPFALNQPELALQVATFRLRLLGR
ncbi:MULTISPECIES: hypothetical protein [unclassified Synechococcus]|uniref:hypothetical protein n=1 Tax=unclassified Synechococcus TaxID=2626047 RepID=UPI0021A50259|nr:MULTISPECIES: hypothetical protein [unclassified Synechococcus]MCT0214070.1 hypothetical protein [Synechococcus sp. CS-1326]MCT0234157.1 hypothetical protein [Synechococcus sp. CS-1327]